MPILITNMGGEMVYILEQRLEAQNVPKDKGQRVMADVTRTMYNASFVGELFKPQEIYSVASVRQVFDRLAHSSIMRLNEASMDKLFDLMLMGFKYQLLSCSYPAEMLQVTLNHLRALQSKVGDAQVGMLVAAAEERVHQVYSTMGVGEWECLRRSLCSFFQGRKVKVSLFLQDGIQRNDGTIVVNVKGVLPPGVAVPGTTRTYGADGREKRTHAFAHPLAAELTLSPPMEQRVCELGGNLYSKERTLPAAETQTSMPLPSTLLPPPAVPPPPVPDSTEKANGILAGERTSAAKGELNLLASLISSEAAPAAPFKINLFPDSLDKPGGSTGGGRVKTITIDLKGKDGGARRHDLDVLISGMDVSTREAREAEPDDLLALMDQAGSK